jgi:thiol-disulfide isomerase/thioredoxin
MLYYASAKDFILQSLDLTSMTYKHDAYIVLIKAEWCPHCTEYEPIFEQYSVKHPNIGFIILESTKNEDLLMAWSKLVNPAFVVNSFPTVMMYNSRGQPVDEVADRFNLDVEIIKALL